MLLLSQPLTSRETACPYIPEELCRFSYFFAKDVTETELEFLLSKGWRKFGFYYFRPVCKNCSRCIPIRLQTNKIMPSKSQRRVIKKGELINTEFKELECRDEIFELYKIHSKDRFSKDADYDEFKNSFYIKSCPSIQSEYYIDNKLIAVGFLDISHMSLSSIYFIYNTEYMQYSPGTLSVFREAKYAASIGLSYYYLGYYIEENKSMSYKNNFRINEKMNWESETWETTDT